MASEEVKGVTEIVITMATVNSTITTGRDQTTGNGTEATMTEATGIITAADITTGVKVTIIGILALEVKVNGTATEVKVKGTAMEAKVKGTAMEVKVAGMTTGVKVTGMALEVKVTDRMAMISGGRGQVVCITLVDGRKDKLVIIHIIVHNKTIFHNKCQLKEKDTSRLLTPMLLVANLGSPK